MTCPPALISDDPGSLPTIPSWIPSGRAKTFETLAFRSGMALTVLDALVANPAHGVPVRLLGNRLALRAAAATSKLEGRLVREMDIRDAYHLTAPGEARGPDGYLLAFWREAVRQRLTGRDWQTALDAFARTHPEAEIDVWIRDGFTSARTYGPLAGCVSVMRAVLKTDDRAERIACLLSDVVLARTLNWKSALPVSAQRLSKAMLRNLVAGTQGADLVVQQSLLGSVEDTIRLAGDLASRAARLRAVTSKLRARGADAAVALFLSEDAVAPGAVLSPMIQGTTTPMTDRAARRFCDRLVELEVAHELTGRSTSRLYGIAP